MPWIHTDPMQQRAKFVLAYQEGAYSMTELCERFAISRKTGYKWLGRYQENGFDGLKDQSRAPQTCPHRTPEHVEEAIVELRRKHPSWGPRKLLAYLKKHRPDLELPAASTAGDLVKRHGLVQTRRRRRPVVHPGARPLVADAPNDVWTADFKGEFLLGSGRYCYPLTVCDAYSRYILSCTALASTHYKGARAVFHRLFREYGLPQAIRSDNGSPFAAQALAGLSRLNVYWTKLDIRHERTEPASPQQNGRHERMHRTLKAEATRPPEQSLPAQQRRFDAFRSSFNHDRPHEALQMETPACLYTCSVRVLPSRVHEPEYEGHYEVRLVSHVGAIGFKSHKVFLSSALKGEWVGLEEVEDGLWSIYFYNMLLGRLNERDFTIRP